MKKYLLISFTLVTTAFLFLSCSKDKPVYSTEEQTTLLNVKYGTDPLQQMDVYLPAGRNKSNTGVMVLIHGGGWIGGDKSDFGLTAESIKNLELQFPGYALINLNYRLVTTNANQYPAAEQDIEAAMKHIWNNLNNYQLSTKTYLLGASAGAHLAALHTLKHNDNGYIKGCIGISGPYNLTTAYNNSGNETKQILEFFLGGTPTEKSTAYHAASPVNFITTGSAKFLLLHGKEDNLVPVSQAAEFKAALEAKNVPVTYFTYSGGHGIPPEHLVEAFQRIKDFIQ